MASISGNRYFNDPALAAAAQNLSNLFAPPSGADAAGWATANAKRAEAARLAQLFDYANDPAFSQTQFDRLGMGAGVWAPSQSFYSVDQGNAVERRGQDVTANTSLRTNAADNARALEQARLEQSGALSRAMLDPVASGATRFVPPSIADLYGVGQTQVGVLSAAPGERVVAPDGSSLLGAPKPLSETEWQAQQSERLRASGQLSDDMLLDTIMGAETPVKVIGPEGAPVYSTPGAAARTGAPAFVDKGAEAKPANGTAVVNGRRVAVYQAPGETVWRTQDGQPIPADTEVFDMAKPQGSAEEVGLSKPANTDVEKQLIDTAIAKDTAVKLRDLIASAPASQGIVGWLRGTAQNFIQTGGEAAAFFGGNVQSIQQRIAAGAEDAGLAESFDPNIPAIDMLANLLAFQYAKTTTGERLSNEMLRASRRALGLDGLSANQASSLARLNNAIQRIEAQEVILRRAREGGVSALAGEAPPAPGAAPMPGAEAAPAVERWERGSDGVMRRAQ